MSKPVTARIGAEREKVVNDYAAAKGCSFSTAICDFIDMANGKSVPIPLISTAAGSVEELGILQGTLFKAMELLRTVRARINSPRPIDADDSAALEQWREERRQIESLFKTMGDLCARAATLTGTLTSLTDLELASLRGLKDYFLSSSTRLKDRLATERDERALSVIRITVQQLDAAIDWLKRLGV